MGTSVSRDMSRIELKNANIYFESLWNHRWDDDLQPARYIDHSIKKPLEAEIELNHKLAHKHKDELVTDIQNLVAEFAPDAIIDASQLVKSTESIKRKIATDENVGGTPRGVGDYLRIRITVRGDDPAKAVSQIEDLREQLMYDLRVTSYKDQFRVPCPEGGHRKFIANRVYGEGDDRIKAEIQICHEGMEIGPHDEAVKALRQCERELAPMVKTLQATHLSAHWGKNFRDLYDFVQEQRRAINNERATELGLNVMLNPEIKHRHDFEAASNPGSNFKPHLANGFHAIQKGVSVAANNLPEGSTARIYLQGLIETHGSPASSRTLQ